MPLPTSPVPRVRPVRRARRGVQPLPDPWDMAMAVGLISALLHCSSFRYFHSPCRVLCTFRSPYLCNIGCRADRGVLVETPQGIRLQFQATLHRRRQQSAGTPAGCGHGKSMLDPMRLSHSEWLEEPFHALAPSLLLREKWPPGGVPALRATKPRKIKRVEVVHEGRASPSRCRT